MIISKNGHVMTGGITGELMTEFLFIVDALKKNFTEVFGEKLAETFLKKAFDDGMAGVEELVKKIDESESEEK